MTTPDPIAAAAMQALQQHMPVVGIKVASGETCECGYWTGNEVPGRTRPVGFREPLDWHRAQVVVATVKAFCQSLIEAETREKVAQEIEVELAIAEANKYDTFAYCYRIAAHIARKGLTS